MKRGYLKKLVAGVLAATLLIGGVSAAGYVKAAAKPKLSKTRVSIEKGKTVTLKLKNNKKKVTWKTSNKKVATVSKKGVVKGINKGTATITASVKVTKKKTNKYKCKVTVTAKKTTKPTAKPTTKPTDNNNSSMPSSTTAKLPNLNEIKIGMTDAQVVKLMGNPVRKDVSPKGFSVWVYVNKAYSQYMLINIDGNKVVGMSGMSSNISYGNVLPAGINRDAFERTDSDWSEVKWYSATNSTGVSQGIAAYSKKLENETVIAFTDYFEEGQKVYFIQVFSNDYTIDDMTEPSKKCVYNDQVMRSMENEIIEMLSVYRVMHGLPKYTRLSGLDNIALAESKSMAYDKLSKAEVRSGNDILMDMIKNGCDPSFYAEDTTVGSMDSIGFFNYLVELREAQQGLLRMDGNKPKFSMIGVGCDFVFNSSKYFVYLTLDYCSDDYK